MSGINDNQGDGWGVSHTPYGDVTNYFQVNLEVVPTKQEVLVITHPRHNQEQHMVDI